jgi:hypothetical protein
MAVISFAEHEPERTWCVAGWAFRQVLDDTISQYPEDIELSEKLEQSKAQKGLILDLLTPELAARITGAIKQVASGILSGTILSGILSQTYGDAVTVEQYRRALQKLLDAIPPNGPNHLTQRRPS